MDKRIYIKNSFYSVINYILLVILSFFVRKALIQSFPIEYTGYEALFADIFTLLSIADMGMDSIITHNLYEQMSNDRSNIIKIMVLAKKLYTAITLVVVVIGTIIFFCLPFIFSADKYDFSLMRIVYIIQIINLSLSYLTGYKRLLLVADQKEYICLKWDSQILLLIQISRIIALIFFRNYYLYCALCIVQTLAQNIGINVRCNREYQELFSKCPQKVSDIFNIKKDMGNFLCHRISSVIYAATDNIVITSFLGLAVTGLYSNYYMVTKYTYSFATKIMKPMQASIGNYLYQNVSDEEKISLLSKLNRFAFIFGAFVCNSLIQLSTPFIIIWLGEEYVQKTSILIMMALNIFVAINQDFIYYFRNSYGKYEFDKWYMMMSAMANVSLSVIWGRFFGLTGVAAATIIGHLFIWYGRVKFVYTEVFKIGIKGYWCNQAKEMLSLGIQIIVVSFMTRHCGTGILACVVREGCVVFVTLINIITVYLEYKQKDRK